MARIALMLPRISLYGGVEQFAYRLSEALAEEHEVDFICSRMEIPPPLGVRAIIVGRIGGFKWIKLLWYVVRAEQIRKKGLYDLVISLGKTWNQDIVRVGGGPQKVFWKLSEKAWPPGISRWSKRFRRYLNPSSWITYVLERRQYTKKNLIVCVSDIVRRWVVNTYPNVSSPTVIYNLPDFLRFTPPTYDQKIVARAMFNLDMEHIAIATATSNFALKGTETLIKTMKLLPENFKLIIAGGRNPIYYKQLALLLNVQNRVLFIGKIDDMIPLYRAVDIFALPTHYDACSNAVLEAMACGLRVLTSKYDGSSFFLPNHWVIQNTTNPQEIANKFLSMIQESIPGGIYLPRTIKAGLTSWLEFINNTIREKETVVKNNNNSSV